MAWLFGGQRAAAGTRTVAAAGPQSEQVDGAQDGPIQRLEIRGLGITVNGLSQTEIWDHIDAKGATHESIFSRSAADYPESSTRKMDLARLRCGLALKLGAGDAVEYTPLPIFVYGPTKHPDNPMGAEFSVNAARQEGSLPFDLFMTEKAVNGAGPSIEDIFKFFDANPDVPFALIFSTDGMVTRKLLEKPGSGLPPDGAVVPAVFDTNVALLVSRPHAADRLRSSVVTEPESVDTRESQYDLVKLWNFYWDETDAYDASFVEKASRQGGQVLTAPHTMSAAWWRSRVPDLLKHTENKGQGQFVPNPWTPVRWTDWQLKQFDESPVLGYLERPVNVRLTDDRGVPMREKDQAAALGEAWKRTIAGGDDGVHPKRIFFDTTNDREWVIPLTQALGSEADAPSTGNVKEGFDVGYRIGNTGINSTPVQIALALMAGYRDGGVSAIVGRFGHFAELARVTPPSETQHVHNKVTRGDNPFLFR